MPTPAQPAPVTPPPEWAVKAAHDLMALYGKRPRNPIYFHLHQWNTERLAAIIARHAPGPISSGKGNDNPIESYRGLLADAPPPAPSCPTEQGELVERLNQAVRLHEHDPLAGERFIRKAMLDAIAALSRQPAPSADVGGAQGATTMDLLRASTKERDELEAEVAAKSHALELSNSAYHEVFSQLRAAPSAVPKDPKTNGLLTHTKLVVPGSAVAQTEAGNDMTALESKEVTEAAFGRWSLLQSRTRSPDCASFKAGVDWSRRAGIAAATDPVLSESSPKYPSVPAVAGGGEVARLVEALETLMVDYECIGRELEKQYGRPADKIETNWKDAPVFKAARAAIAATIAKEGGK